MNPRVEEYLAGVQKEIDAAKAKEAEEARKEREQTLISLGLYTEEKEYAPEDIRKSYAAATRMGYTNSERIDGETRFFRSKKAAIEVTDEEFEAILKAKAAREALGASQKQASKPAAMKPAQTPGEAQPVKAEAVSAEYEMTPADDYFPSSAASFIRVLAWIIWIGGFILAIASSISKEYMSARETKTTFLWVNFFTLLITYGVYGGLMMCAAELFSDVRTIAGALKRMNILPRKK